MTIAETGRQKLSSPVVGHGHGVAESVSDGHSLEVDLVLRRLELVLRVNLMASSIGIHLCSRTRKAI